MQIKLQVAHDMPTAMTRLTLVCIIASEMFVTDETLRDAADLDMVRLVAIEDLCENLSKQLGKTVKPVLPKEEGCEWGFEVINE